MINLLAKILCPKFSEANQKKIATESQWILMIEELLLSKRITESMKYDITASKGRSNIIEKIEDLENWASKTKNNYPIIASDPEKNIEELENP